ncbi:hypothetical protein AC578_1885 [Pseudocercospora eumusae]|uniref:Uncharacterized protein n=1 Tax=Pseudocercospora eumusae TaxID=321146 RepID=A0A139H3F1_9PEZI|nr:hypothetical protein AC578_1885 [Pseudocercospora eumusae]KXS97005.1 hypothetical protein AC578_1885 [Pseudocercospora eumusae]KXS97007.1 hypothetical protein AC578_1885 [Pseudocercospora eumusae]
MLQRRTDHYWQDGDATHTRNSRTPLPTTNHGSDLAMNKFLKKKPDGHNASDEALPLPTQPSSPTLKKPSTSRWKKSKKAPEVRPQLDLSAALPSTDDFRTSLIMPSLSTRFSMLREQDDPTSLLGKASDDSVLQPRRKSRLADFGLPSSALADIAEVSSLHGSFRPPFTHDHREHSYLLSEDGYGSDAEALGGSIMSRSRPGEGNVLFGGRQKIYKIPTSGAASTKSLGKLVYDDDVGYSAFQKYRQREREEDESHFPRPSNDSQAFDFGLDQVEPDDQDDDGQRSLLMNDSAKDLSHSPSLSSYDRKRSTTSSDAHSIARSSTAATSIASQPALSSAAPSPAYAPATAMAPAPPLAPVLDRSNTKTRRLYEQGLDQHIQDQQTSAITRLNSIQRQCAMSGKKTPPFLQSTKSAGNLQDRVNQPVHALRGQSPSLSSPLPPQLNSFGSVRHANSASPSPVPSGPQSPIESPFDESNNVLAQALEPADRGKATAMGAFNKPAHAFDEQQYLERQKQLQRSTSSAAVLKTKVPQPQQSAFHHQRITRYEDDQSEYHQPNNASPDPSTRARSQSVSKHEPSKAYTVFQNAVNQFPVVKPSAPSVNKSTLPDTHRTFFGNISASDDEDEEEVSEIAKSFNQPEYGYGGYHSKWQPTPLPSVSEHPALREMEEKSSLAEDAEDDERSRPNLRQKASAHSLRRLEAKPGALVRRDLDSPTLGPQSQALSGMMHHLRQKSNNSSIYPAESVIGAQQDEAVDAPDAPWTTGSTLDMQQASVRSSHYTASNPWDLDEAISGASSAVERPERRSEIPLDQDGAASDRVSEVSSIQSSVPSWQHELQKQQHTRDPSNATLQDREAFSRDLAARRDAIRENLKSYVETNNSRAASPVPGAPGPLRAFGMMRAKSSGESLATMRDQHAKASKGLGANSNASVNNLTKDERSGFSLDMARPRGNSSPRPSMPPPVSQHPAFKNEVGESVREAEIGELPKERQLASSRSPAVSAGRNRSRSNSATTTGRSRSRTGPYRDDLEKAMIEGHGSSAAAHEPTPDASPAILPSDRDSDVSRLNMQAYFDQKMGFAAQNMSRLAPNGPQSAPLHIYTPGRPAPVANPYTSNPTPPLSASGNGTSAPASPVTFSPEQYSPIVPSSARPNAPLRKKTILKSEISEPTLISSTSNVDTVDLPPGASLKNGMDQPPPPIPPINPRRRGTRKLFGLGGSKDASDKENELPKLTQSDPNLLLQASPNRTDQGLFPPSNVVRMPARQESPALQQYGFNQAESPERRESTRAVTGPMGAGEVGMF